MGTYNETCLLRAFRLLYYKVTCKKPFLFIVDDASYLKKNKIFLGIVDCLKVIPMH